MSWKEIRIEAYIWWCGDEICDCHQPVIDEISPNYRAGYPWIKRKRLWEGSFFSQPDPEEWKQMEKELKEECKKRKLTFASLLPAQKARAGE